jgi:hypothetical protein
MTLESESRACGWAVTLVDIRRAAPAALPSGRPASPSAFVINEYDSETGVGWSVIIHGSLTTSPMLPTTSPEPVAGQRRLRWHQARRSTIWPSNQAPSQGVDFIGSFSDQFLG